MRRMPARSLAALLLLGGLGSGCARQTHRSAEQLRAAYVEVLPSSDAAGAYAMLSPEVQAEVSFEDFETRWKADAAERQTMSSAARKMSPEQGTGLRGGSTVHAGGRVLRWTELDGKYYVAHGLPGAVQSATPAQTVRALIAAVHGSDLTAITSLLSADLSTALAEDWQARVEAIEAALDQPGSIELTADLHRAELRYEPTKVLTLEQTPTGWRITALE